MWKLTGQSPIVSVVRQALIFVFASVLLLCSLGLSQAIAAPQAVARDPQALTLIASSLKALTGGVAVNDVILQAAAAYVAGSDQESGTATLTARGNQQSLGAAQSGRRPAPGDSQRACRGLEWGGRHSPLHGHAQLLGRRRVVLPRLDARSPASRSHAGRRLPRARGMERGGHDPPPILPHRPRADPSHDGGDSKAERR